jgi:threonine/homoserine/homoserine lactone efflux protein
MTSVLPALGIFLMALISPGADFSVTLKNSIASGRKAGILTALGISVGNMIHISYIIFGLGVLLKPESKFILVLRVLGCIYLIYLGMQCLMSKKPTENKIREDEKKTESKRTWFSQGLITNLLNANCPLFMISVFSTLISQSMSVVLIVGIIVPLMAFTWFSIVSSVFSIGPVHRTFMHNATLINRALGILLIAFGIRILLL